MNIQDEKNNIRRDIKNLKASIGFEEKANRSLFVFKKLEEDLDFIKSKNILAYWSMNDEVNTHSFVQKWANSKKIYLPAMIGNILEFRLFESINDLKKDPKYGIYEPVGEVLKNYDSIDYAIIPGIAFDNKNNRLGRGKAFYDRILSSISAKKVGVCFSFQLINSVPVEDTDIKMDLVISE